MEVSLALVADAANISREGKLNIMGIFSEIRAIEFPAVHSHLVLVVQFEAGPAEWGTTKSISIPLLDPDGREVLSLSMEAAIPRPEDPGYPQVIHSVLGLGGVVFPHPGDYAFYIKVNGETKQRVPIKVRRIEEAQNA